MSKYLLEQKKGMNRPDKRAHFVDKYYMGVLRLKKTVKDINEKIQGLIKNVMTVVMAGEREGEVEEEKAQQRQD